jgi:hypothetical protein
MSEQKWIVERLDRIVELLERQVQLQEELMFALAGQDEGEQDAVDDEVKPLAALCLRNPGRIPEEQANLAEFLLSALKQETHKDLTERLFHEEYVFPTITNQHWVN